MDRVHYACSANQLHQPFPGPTTSPTQTESGQDVEINTYSIHVSLILFYAQSTVEYVYKRTSSQIHRLENHFSDPAPLEALRVVTSHQGYHQGSPWQKIIAFNFSGLTSNGPTSRHCAISETNHLPQRRSNTYID
jgi:hypothetical protein